MTADSVTGPWTRTEYVITGSSAKPWHLDVQRVGGAWHALIHTTPNDGSGGDLHAAVSLHGINFVMGSPLIPRGKPGVDWDASYYKSCFVPGVRDGFFGWDAWIGGAKFAGPGPIIGRTFIRFDAVDERMAAAESVSISLADQVDLLMALTGQPSRYKVVDTFDRPNGPLGNADTGQSWNQSAGIMNVSGGRAVPSSAANTRPVIDSGRANHKVSVTLPLGGAPAVGQHWIVTRYTDPSNYYRYGYDGVGVLMLQRIAAGAVTELWGATAPGSGAGDVLSIEWSGSGFVLHLNGTEVASGVDSIPLPATPVLGMQASTTTACFDRFMVKAT